MAIKIDSIVLIVSDLERSIEFYRDKLGMPIRYKSRGFVAFDAGAVPLQLESLNDATKTFGTEPLLSGQQAGHRLALTVRVEDVDAAYKELENKGVRFIKPPTDMPWGHRNADFSDPMETYGYCTNLWKDNAHNTYASRLRKLRDLTDKE